MGKLVSKTKEKKFGDGLVVIYEKFLLSLDIRYEDEEGVNNKRTSDRGQ